MKTTTRSLLVSLILAIAVVLGGSLAILPTRAAKPQDDPGGRRWFKGNTHTHTLNSDGDSSPGVVAHWYRDHDYDFLVISDHNYYTVVDEMQREFDREHERLKKRRFLLIPGEEVTDLFASGESKHALHVNGVNTTRQVGEQGGKSVVDVLQRCVDAIHSAGGLPHINHPNFYWSITADHLHALKRLRHFEIFNGHPAVHNVGGGGHPGLEAMWDDLLGRGRQIFGVAVDDAHHFTKWGPRESNPGRGWVVVRAAELGREAILGALQRGDYYCSTGVELEDVSMAGGALRLRIRQLEDTRYRTEFIGKNGRLLKLDVGLEPGYELGEDDLYVRAKVTSSAGEFAWTQAVFRRS